MSTSHRPLILALALLPVLGGCSPDTPQLSSRLSVALPLEATELEYLKVEVTYPDGSDSHEVIGTPDSGDLEVSFEVPAGVEVQISVTLFNLLEEVGFYVLEDGTSVTLEPGEQSIVLTPVDAGSVSTTITAVFTDGAGKVLQIPAVLDLQDDVTGVLLSGALSSMEPFDLPVGRVFTVSGSHPVTGVAFTAALTVDASGVAQIEVGEAPVDPLGSPSASIARGLTTALEEVDTDYGLECALGIDCSAEVDFVSCDTIDYAPGTQFLEGTDEQIQLLVRYVGVAGSCVALPIDYDLTPPRVSVIFEPSFYSPGSLGDTTVATISANELIIGDTAGDELTLALIDAAGEVQVEDVCLTNQPGPASELTCTIDLAGYTGLLTFRAGGTDVAGNPFEAVAALNYLAPETPPTGPALVISKFQPHPQVPSAGQQYVPIEVELTNIGDAAASSAFISWGEVSLQGAMGEDFSVLTRTPVEQNFDLPVGGSVSSWVMLRNWATYMPPFVEEGVYSVDLAVDWTDDIGTPISDILSAPMQIAIAPVRWLTNDSLHYGDLVTHELANSSGSNYSYGVPLTPLVTGGLGAIEGGEGSSRYTVSFSVADLLTWDSSQGTIGIGTIGAERETFVTITNDDAVVLNSDTHSDAVRVRLWESPKLLALQDVGSGAGKVYVIDTRSGATTAHDLDSAIGTPLQVLWEPTRNRIIAVGSTGLMLDVTDPTSTLTTPCGLDFDMDDMISSAALTAAAPGHSRASPDVALLLQRSGSYVHCEINLDDGSEVVNATLLNQACTGALVSNAVTGEFAVMGEDSGMPCTQVYQTHDGVVTAVSSGAPGPDAIGAATYRAAYDPYGNWAVTLANDGFRDGALGWSLGADQDPRASWYVEPSNAGYDRIATAVEVDAVYGRALVASYKDEMEFPEGDGITAYDDRSSSPLGTEGLRTTAGQMTTALALDNANRRLYFATGSQAGGGFPAWGVANPDGLAWTFHDATPVTSFGSTGPIVELVVAGPQAMRLSTHRPVANELVTVTGTGFSGFTCDGEPMDGRCLDEAWNGDHVFVQGLEAAVKRTTPTAITFEVPGAFADLDRELYWVAVTVLSHQVMSGPVPISLVLAPEPVGHSVYDSGSGSVDTFACMLCGWSTMVQGPYEDSLKSHDNGFTLTTGFEGTSAMETELAWAPTPEQVESALAGYRAIGLVDNAGAGAWQWFDFKLDAPSGTYEQARTFEVTGALGTYSALGPMALSPDEKLMAVVAGRDIHFLWAPTLAPHPLGAISNALGITQTVAGLEFDDLGQTLVIADGSGAVSTIDLTAPGVPTPASEDATGCPSTADAVVELSPYGPFGATTLITWHEATTQVAIWSVKQEPTGAWAKTCRGTTVIAHDDTAPPVAAVSPMGDLIGLVTVNVTDMEVAVTLVDGKDPSVTWDTFTVSGVQNTAPLDALFTRSGNTFYTPLGGFETSTDAAVSLHHLPVAPY